jgi:hypothetical protein
MTASEPVELLPAPEAPPDPTLWQRLMALFTTEGVPWADNANALLPDEFSGREAVLRKRKQYQQLEDIAKDR